MSNIRLPFDPLLLLATIGLCVCSVIAIQSSSVPGLASHQELFIAIGFVIGAAVSRVDVLRLRELQYGLYAVLIIGLIAVLLFGAVTKGSRLAIPFGPIQLQFSEFGKILIALSVGAMLVNRQRRIGEWSTTMRAIAMFGGALILIMGEPDLGSAIVYVVMFFLMLSLAGTPARHLQVLGGAVVLVVALTLVILPSAGVHPLKRYQTDRLTSFLHPAKAAAGAGYNQHQAVIAIGAGGRTGAGVATQAKYKYLPENQTDFIFSVFSQRFGFAGSALVLSLYALLLWRVLRVLVEARSSYAAIVVSGLIGMLAFQIFENVGMNLGIMPITGVTLPLMSYGGSSVIATLIALGLVHSVYAHGQSARSPRVGLAAAQPL